MQLAFVLTGAAVFGPAAREAALPPGSCRRRGGCRRQRSRPAPQEGLPLANAQGTLAQLHQMALSNPTNPWARSLQHLQSWTLSQKGSLMYTCLGRSLCQHLANAHDLSQPACLLLCIAVSEAEGVQAGPERHRLAASGSVRQKAGSDDDYISC